MLGTFAVATSFIAAVTPEPPWAGFGGGAAGVVAFLLFAGYAMAVGTYLLTRSPAPGWRGPRLAGALAVVGVGFGTLARLDAEDAVSLPALAIMTLTTLVVLRTVRRPPGLSAAGACITSVTGGIMVGYVVLGSGSDGPRPMSPIMPPVAHAYLGVGLLGVLAAFALVTLLVGPSWSARAATSTPPTDPTPPRPTPREQPEPPHATDPVHPRLRGVIRHLRSSPSAGFSVLVDDSAEFTVGDLEVQIRVTVARPGLWQVHKVSRGQPTRVFRTNDRHAVDAFLIAFLDSSVGVAPRRRFRDVVEPARIEATPTGHIVRWADHSWAEVDGPSAVGNGRWRAEELAERVNVDLNRLLAR